MLYNDFVIKNDIKARRIKMSRKSSSPTMKDVAAEAGVALGTVSKVVNGLPVGREYYEKVMAAIEKLDYKLNTYAQGLKASSTNTVALLIPNTINPFFAQLTYYINCALSKRNYRLLLWCTDENPQLEQFFLGNAQQSNVDGVICLSYSNELNFPVKTSLVTIDRQIDPSIPCITSDNFGGGQLAAKQLFAMGCKKVSFMGIGSPLASESSKRADGFRSACDALGMECDIFNVPDGTSYDVFADYLNSHINGGRIDIDGIFCITDNMARIVMHNLKKAGLEAPRDIQIIGFDGIRDYATYELMCSTLVQNIESIAKMSVETVLSKERMGTPSLVCLPVEYAYGGTTKE